MRDIGSQKEMLPDPLCQEVAGLVSHWSEHSNSYRLWSGDASLWTSADEANWLGWLAVADEQLERLAELREFAEKVNGRFTHAVLLGMGGSSLCPEVLSLCFGRKDGFPEFRVVDSTVPGQAKAVEDSIRFESTLFLAASKSGSTLETALLTDYFLERLIGKVGTQEAAEQFVAITDPGSRLEAKALAAGFGHVFHGVPSIGGRYSALSDFGIVPAAAMGLDVQRLLEGAEAMVSACGPDVPARDNPGVRLGLLLGAAASTGRDKLTLIASPEVAPLGAWIEQLVAESTGKQGKGIVPVDGEMLVDPSRYGPDRVFVTLDLASGTPAVPESVLMDFAAAGHPVVRVATASVDDIAQEFFRWEVATAVAGAVLGINPFDQPDVESAKVAARELTAAYAVDGSLPSDEPFFMADGIELFAGKAYADRLMAAAGSPTLSTLLGAHLSTLKDGDYFALLAFIARNRGTSAALARIRDSVRSRTKAATCIGFGPRFLHSTGQLHKGGADNGVILQVGCADAEDIEIPGQDLSFGVVKAAQALGDFQVLTRLGRRALRVHLHGPLDDGLNRLEAAIR